MDHDEGKGIQEPDLLILIVAFMPLYFLVIMF